MTYTNSTVAKHKCPKCGILHDLDRTAQDKFGNRWCVPCFHSLYCVPMPVVIPSHEQTLPPHTHRIIWC